MDIDQQAQKRMEQATDAVREYAGADALNAMIRMLEATAEVYRHQLVDATDERIPQLQTQVKQLRALTRVLRGEPHVSPAN